MSQFQTPEPTPAARRAAIEHVIAPRVADLGGVMVRRALPAQQVQMIGPFIFFDEFGPAEFLLGEGLDISPHPHIGLTTVTYLFDGEIAHRDSLGSDQVIRPGELNLMHSGRGIVHSERTPQAARTGRPKLYGVQTWMAHPRALEDAEPSFVHHGAQDLPTIEDAGKQVKLIMGSMYGATAAARTPTQTIYADAILKAGASLPFDADVEERGFYVATGEVEADGARFGAGRLIVLRPGEAVAIRALADSRLILLGGEPMDGPRFIWWNFVSSRKETMIAAAHEWEAGRMPSVPGDDENFVLLR
ncbi:MAG: pirin [Hyphomicrobiales bacterium]|nr:pirin [Hyphomicrobiales bacterium]